MLGIRLFESQLDSQRESALFVAHYFVVDQESPNLFTFRVCVSELLGRSRQVSKQGVSPFYRDLHLLTKLNSCYHERNVFRFPENGALFLSRQRVSPRYHDLDLDLVGLVGKFLLVEQLPFWLSGNF